jgi:hypothetical protein
VGWSSRLAGVLAFFHVTGRTTICSTWQRLHPDALREFVLDRLTADPAVVQAATSLILEHVRGTTGV